MKSEDEALVVIELALREAGADEADAHYISTDRNVSRFANSNLGQNMSEISGTLTLRVVMGGRIGVASTTSIAPEDIREAAGIARESARRSQPAEGFQGLYGVDSAAPVVDSFDEETANLPAKTKAEGLSTLFRQGAEQSATYAGFYTTAASSVAAGNSRGIRRYARQTRAEAVIIALTSQHSGFASLLSRSCSSISLAALGAEALSKAKLHAGDSKSLDPAGEFAVILEPAAVAEVLEWMGMITFSGRSFEDGSSLFCGHFGERLFSENLTIADDPLDPEFLPFPFDAEGVPKKRFPLIDDGRVAGPAVDKLFSDRLALPLTGSSADLASDEHGIPLHISVAPGVSPVDELIASTERGVWVTRFHYVNGLLDPKTALMTGMTRDGTFLIEGGKVTGRLPNLRWTQSMTAAFASVEGLSVDRRASGVFWNPIGGIISPAMKIGKWNFEKE